MDYNELFDVLLPSEGSKSCSFDESLQEKNERLELLLSEDLKLEMTNEKIEFQLQDDTRMRYLHNLLFMLRKYLQHLSTSDAVSVALLKKMKSLVEIAVSLGIIPHLLPGVGFDFVKLCPRAAEIPKQEMDSLQQYRILSLTITVLMRCFDESILRPIVIKYLGPLLAALLQLSYAPLSKPSVSSSCSSSQDKFSMDVDLYEKLKGDQLVFQEKLKKLIEYCPQSAVITEFMVLLGEPKSPKFLKMKSRNYLLEIITGTNGIASMINAICEDSLDIGRHWDKLDLISKLIASAQSPSNEVYYNSVCSQILQLLSSREISHSFEIACYMITIFHETRPEICKQKLLNEIMGPLLNKSQDKNTSEENLSKCIEDLSRMFTNVDSNVKTVPCTVMMGIALPLFLLSLKAQNSVYYLKNKIDFLLVELLKQKQLQNDLFSTFLNIESSNKFGDRLFFSAGPKGGFQVFESEVGGNSNYKDLADRLYALTKLDKSLPSDLFIFLLENLHKVQSFGSAENQLGTDEDKMADFEKPIVIGMLLTELANDASVQKETLSNPEPLLTFIKSMFDTSKSLEEESSVETLYMSLTLIKVLLSEQERAVNWTLFKDFTDFLNNKKSNFANLSDHVKNLIDDLAEMTKKQNKGQRRYEDVSSNSRSLNEFEKALKDIADPLLPVRAHGLIAMTKLIESKDAVAIERKDALFCFFQENLKHEDSFIYLAAVNGLCALANSFPEKVLEILIQEYIDMPGRTATGEITPDIRAKLGEILVKTTRSLGEMAVKHKSLLINGFLCGTRDDDTMVRASSLSCLGELCKVLGFRLGHALTEILYCISCIIKTDKEVECRRAAVLVATLLIKGLGRDVLQSLGSDLVVLYRGLKHLRDNDNDSVLRLHAQLALEELDEIVQNFLFEKPKLGKTFTLPL